MTRMSSTIRKDQQLDGDEQTRDLSTDVADATDARLACVIGVIGGIGGSEGGDIVTVIAISLLG